LGNIMNIGTKKPAKTSTAKKPAAASKGAAVAAPKPAEPKTPAASKNKGTAAAAKKPAAKSTAVAVTAPAKVPAKKVPALAPAKRASKHEVMLARVESVRLSQRTEGHFDCFGRAAQGFCDQGGCSYHAECLSISGMLHSV
jgi:hypothetical protein